VEGLSVGEKGKEGDIGLEALTEERRVPRGRECPVPKPGGLVGQILGFKKDDGGEFPCVIKVEPVRRRRVGREPPREEGATS